MGKGLKIVGNWKARTPICQKPPAPKKGSSPFPVSYQRVCYGEEGCKKFADVPVISGNAVRSMIREKMNKAILQRLEPGTMDLDTLLAQCIGGAFSATARTKAEIHQTILDVRRRNLLIDLLGCATRQTGMIRGRISVHDALAECAETGFPGYPSAKDLLFTAGYSRKDDTEDFEIFSMLSPEGVEELAGQEETAEKTRKGRNGKAVSEEKSDEVGEPDGEGEKQAFLGQIYSVDAVASGTEFIQEIVADGLCDAQIGAIIAAFRDFAGWPVIGGMANKGFGKVDLAFRAVVTENGIQESWFDFSVEDGEFSLNNVGGVMKPDTYLAAWAAYLDSIHGTGDISIPACPEPTKTKGKGKTKPTPDADETGEGGREEASVTQ